ncbi:flap structure-specific endonuclease, partial [Candidatus Pacearchaeota archaeon]|nr:flap structure-specific endonuclease [Candidatus Pacearchaeota archaeon]
MGLSIRDIVPRTEFDMSELKGKTICVDAFNTLYQFLSSVRQMDGTPLQDSEGRITSHLSGILYRNVA